MGKTKYRKQAVNGGFVIEKKDMGKWRNLDKYGEIGDHVLFCRNEEIANQKIKEFEQRDTLREPNYYWKDSQLPTDDESSAEVSE